MICVKQVVIHAPKSLRSQENDFRTTAMGRERWMFARNDGELFLWGTGGGPVGDHLPDVDGVSWGESLLRGAVILRQEIAGGDAFG